MQFSKVYRENLLANIKTVFERSDSYATQTTYFMSGAAPSREELTRILDGEWTNPTGAQLAPTHESSSFNAQYLGHCTDFLKTLSWSNYEQNIVLTNDLSDDINGNIANYTAPVALFGEPQASPSIEGFDHTLQGDQTITWALTLWAGKATSASAIYVMHQVGGLLDSNAEIVVQSPMLTSSAPTLPLINVYSPIL